MYYQFDRYGRLEQPNLVLCLPNRKRLCSLGAAFNIQMDLKYNNWSELRFTIPYPTKTMFSGDNKALLRHMKEYYESVEVLKYIEVPHYGWFILQAVDIQSNGIREVKECTAYSCEYELAFKNINSLEGTFQFYDPLRTGETLMGIIINQLPGWKLGVIDGAVINKYRTFDVKEQDIYSFLVKDVANVYECIFEFDTFTQTINVRDANKAFPTTSIFMSFHNLMKEVNIKPNTDNIVTALHVYGSGDLSTRSINPNGTDTIYNVSYYKNTDWMSQPLIDALDRYEEKYTSLQPAYSLHLAELQIYNKELILLKNNAPIYDLSFTDTRTDIMPPLSDDNKQESRYFKQRSADFR